MIDEAIFETQAMDMLRALAARIEDALADAVDVELQGAILTLELEDGRQFVINKHTPTRQLWLSSPLSGAAHFERDAAGAWRATREAATLAGLLSAELSQATGVDIRLD